MFYIYPALGLYFRVQMFDFTVCVSLDVRVPMLSLCVFGLFSSGKARTLPGRQGVSKINSVLSAGLSRGQFQAPTLLFTHYWPRLYTHTHTHREQFSHWHTGRCRIQLDDLCSRPNTSNLTSSNQPDQPHLKINSTENKLISVLSLVPHTSSCMCIHSILVRGLDHCVLMMFEGLGIVHSKKKIRFK